MAESDKDKEKRVKDLLPLATEELLSAAISKGMSIRSATASRDDAPLASGEFREGCHYVARVIYAALQMVNLDERREVEAFEEGIRRYLSSIDKP